MKQSLCSCGRPAEWIGKESGEPECFELIDLRRHPLDTKIVWDLIYNDGPRHKGDK